MKVKKYKDFILEYLNPESDISLSYCCYDWDDNLLKMPTVIHMETSLDGKWVKEDVTTAKFAQIRSDKDNWRLLNNNPEDTFSEFRDNGPRGVDAFLDDTKKAISSKSFAPSWNKFIDTLVNGNIFCIITARGHNSDTMRSGVEYIIYNYLTEVQRVDMLKNLKKFETIFGESKEDSISSYLDNCDFYGVSSPEFLEIAPGGGSNPEKGKEIAIHMFTDKVHKFATKISPKKVQLSFSDDDKKNVEHIEKFMRNELSLKYMMQYNIFDTSDQSIEGGKRTKVTERKKY